MKSVLMKPHLVGQTFAGNKTHTRRVIKGLNSSHTFYGATLDGYYFITLDKDGCTDFKTTLVKPKYRVGETIYVKEAFKIVATCMENSNFHVEIKYPDGSYWGHPMERETFEKYYGKAGKKCSPLFMPEIFARLYLRITDVRVERLQDISEEDAVKEGVEKIGNGYKNYNPGIDQEGSYFHGPSAARASFFSLIASIHSQELLDANPWVFVYEFERVEKP